MKVKIIYILLLVCTCGISCENKHPHLETQKEGKTSPSIELEGVRFTQTENGAVLWYLTAAKAQLFEDKGYVILHNIGVKFIEGGEREVLVHGKKGRLEIEKKDFTLEGNVIVTSSDGMSFESEHLIWNSGAKLIEVDSPVKITKGNTSISSSSLKANSNLEKVWVKGNVETVIQ